MRLFRAVFCLIISASATYGAEPGYYRQPAIHGNTIVFVAEGDLWTVPVKGGRASRLTSHPAAEGRPAISPDGTTLAFTAKYEGPDDVYIMPLSGGRPRRLTFDGAKISHVGWTPGGNDGKPAKVLVGTDAYSGLPAAQLVALGYESLAGPVSRTIVPLAQAAEGCYSPDGRTLYFTRLAFQGSYTRRYKGGTAQQLWSFHDGDREAKPMTADYPGTSKSPMFFGGRVYFASDRDGTMNLWSIRPDGTDPRQHTRHKDFDVASPNQQGGRIVYQHGADLWLLDIASGKYRPIPITLNSDFDQTRERWINEPMEFLTDAHASPDGTNAVVTARGRVFVLPAKGGRLVEAGRKPGVRYRDARFMPDGKNLLVLSDESGEVELWTVPANGVGEAARLTIDGTVLRQNAVPSPDGKLVAYTDKNLRLFLLNVQTKENTRLAQSTVDEFEDLTWSGDSKYLAFVQHEDNRFRRVMLYSVATGKIAPVATDRYESFSPAFSRDGKWLYLLSDRNLKSAVKKPWGPYQPEPFFDKPTTIYQLPLMPGLRSPFAPATELDPDEAENTYDKKKGDEKEPKKLPPAAINLDGIAARLMPVPVPPGTYRSLAVSENALFWLSYAVGEEKVGKVEAVAIGRHHLEVKTVADNVTMFELSGDGNRILCVREKELLLGNAAAEALDAKKSHVDLSGWRFSIKPREEWRQMFADAWRMERDYFFDPGMRGLDWPAIRKKYEVLLPRVTDRIELDDLIAQMVSELSALHTFVIRADVRKGPDDISIGRLGALLESDGTAGGYRVERVYANDPDEPERASPLALPGAEVKAGDVILSIDGDPALAATDAGELLRDKAGRQVLLVVRHGHDKPRRVVVVPLGLKDEADLRYHEWEYTRRLKVDELGGGEIAYIHLRAMKGEDFESWARGYYPAFAKSGLIIDVRNNRGGNIDSWIVGRLLRKAWAYWNQRVGRENSWNMQEAFRGHVAVLCNEWTLSDGEAFCEAVKRLKLGKVIGTRTWGGGIWLSFDNELLDKGLASAAESGVFAADGKWLVEGHGVEPDLRVDNLPHATFLGQDAQLEATVRLLKRQIAKHPVVLPQVPPFPRKR
jgi:tricorn protease